MSLIGNGKSSVRNHFSSHHKTNLHLVATELPTDSATQPQMNSDVVSASVSDSAAALQPDFDGSTPEAQKPKLPKA